MCDYRFYNEVMLNDLLNERSRHEGNARDNGEVEEKKQKALPRGAVDGVIGFDLRVRNVKVENFKVQTKDSKHDRAANQGSC